MVSIDVSDLYKKVFGIELFDDALFYKVKSNEIEDSEVKSYIGMPVVMPVYFKKGTYNTLNKGQIETIEFKNDYRLPDTTLVDFQREKNIISTSINGGGATVDEMYSFTDWNIRIYGAIIETDVAVEDQLRTLLQWENITDGIAVRNVIFEILGIQQIIIKSIDLKQVQGKLKVRPFVLNCKSTEPIELNL